MRLRLAIGFLISAGCLVWVLRGVDFQILAEAVRSAKPGWILLAASIYGLAYLFRAFRWAALWKPLHPVTPWRLLPVIFIGFMANCLLPLRMGELVRAHLAGVALGVSRSASLATIVVERLTDMISFLATFCIVTFFIPFPAAIQKSAFIAAAVSLAAIVGLLLALRHQEWTQAQISRIPLRPAWRERILHLFGHFVRGLSGLRDLGALMKALVYSAGVWLVEGTVVYFLALAYLPEFAYAHAFFVLFFLGISVTLPQAPEYVGTYEFFGVMALGLVGIAKETALSMILTLHALQFVYVVAAGLICLAREGLSWKSIERLSY